MKTSLKNALATFLLLAAALLIAGPVTAQAKASNIQLDVNRTYKQYDFTGDKKPDKLRVSTNSQDSDSYGNCKVYLNGKKMFSIKGRRYYEFRINRLELKNNKTYLAIIPVTDNADIPGAAIYQFKSGKFNKVVNLDAMSQIGYHNSAKVIKVSGNKITVEHCVMSYALGAITFNLDYQYKNGKLVQTTTKPKLTDFYLKYIKKPYWTAAHSMKVLKNPDGKRITTLKKGQKVKIDKIYLNAKHTKIYLHVKIKGGKSGWVKGWTKGSSSPSDVMFKEVVYAG